MKKVSTILNKYFYLISIFKVLKIIKIGQREPEIAEISKWPQLKTVKSENVQKNFRNFLCSATFPKNV